MKYKELFTIKCAFDITFYNNDVYVYSDGKLLSTMTLLLRNYLRKRGEYPFVLSNDKQIAEIEKRNLTKLVKEWWEEAL